jgi:hypothetical protein
VAALRDEGVEPFASFGNGVRRRDAERVEAVLSRLFGDQPLQFCAIGQKSRSP